MCASWAKYGCGCDDDVNIMSDSKHIKCVYTEHSRHCALSSALSSMVWDAGWRQPHSVCRPGME